MGDFTLALKKMGDNKPGKDKIQSQMPAPKSIKVPRLKIHTSKDEQETKKGKASQRRKIKKPSLSTHPVQVLFAKIINNNNSGKIIGYSLGSIAILIFIIGNINGWFDLNAMFPSVTTKSPTNSHLSIPTMEPSNTFTPNPTTTFISTLTMTLTPTVMPTQTFTLTPTTNPLEIYSTKISEKDGMEMVFVPAGEFTMGSPEEIANDNEHPQHEVYLDAYWIDQTEVTNAMYRKCVIAGSCSGPFFISSYSYKQYFWDQSFNNYPVISIDWNQAQAYCIWAGRQLPTEAQWEKAARGTDSRSYPWGNKFDCNKGNFDDETYIDLDVVQGGPNCDGYSDTSPVGTFKDGVSPYGALDMAGNVKEWVADFYGLYSYDQLNNPTGPSSGSKHVIRGGSWIDLEGGVNTTFRYGGDTLYNNTGFRCALSVTVSP